MSFSYAPIFPFTLKRFGMVKSGQHIGQGNAILKAASYLTWVRGGAIEKGSDDGEWGACLA